MSRNRISFVQTSTLTPRMHQKLTEHDKILYAKQPTQDQNFGWLNP